MMKKLFNFLFGKKPDIFNSHSSVEHQLNAMAWQKWQDKYQKGAEYDWQQHEGTYFSHHNSEKQRAP